MLPDTLRVIESLQQQDAREELLAEVHKLHGACCYTGLPRLQHLAKELEIALKLEQAHLIDEYLPDLIKEAHKIIFENTESH
jgi:two-component system sensor histidine kinase BarA